MIEPRNSKIIRGLARALNKAGDNDNLLNVIRGALSLDPNFDVSALDIRNEERPVVIYAYVQ